AGDFQIDVTDVDGTGGDTDHAIVNLIDNDPAANTISENVLADALVHITAFATDEDGDNITYELVDNAAGRFKIDANTGVVTVADASLIDFEINESHIIKIKAKSSDNSTVEENFTILVTDEDGDTDHPITDLIDNEERENVISENAINDAPVHITAHATDLDDDAITYHLIDDDNGRFKIEELSGEVTVKDESQIDFESNASHSIRIEARSADGSKIAGDFPIFVTDVDDTGGDTDHAITNLIDIDPADNIISEFETNDSPVHITALATDADGDVISYHLLDDAGGRFKIEESSGIVTIANETLIDFEMDESHLIRIEAISADGSKIAGDFTILITDVNEILQANDDSSQVNEDDILNGENLLTNDYKVPGTNLTINTNPVVDVTNGNLVIHNDGTYTYTPNLEFSGIDSFVYGVCDDGSPQQCDQAAVNITIIAVNDGPLAMDDEAHVNEDEILDGASVLDNDSDVDSDSFEINTSPIEDVEHGILTINTNGTYTYIPDADYNGTDKFTYEICDNENLAACGQATVTISVLPVNDAPRVFDFEMEVKEASLNNPINLESPFDPDGDELSVKILATVDFGEIVLLNGQILNDNDIISIDDLLSMEFNTGERFIGELTMLYEVSDEDGLSTQGKVKIVVVPIDVFIPNAITPNNDNLNDKFKIVGLERFPDNSLEIFNRWGNIVYEKRDYDNKWEGYGNVSGQISNDRLPPGTYFYVFKFGVNKKPLSGYVYMTY
ncbi:Ig-like domain-containing protein, partial [Ancylomarina sp. YFZ004]